MLKMHAWKIAKLVCLLCVVLFSSAFRHFSFDRSLTGSRTRPFDVCDYRQVAQKPRCSQNWTNDTNAHNHQNESNNFISLLPVKFVSIFFIYLIPFLFRSHSRNHWISIFKCDLTSEQTSEPMNGRIKRNTHINTLQMQMHFKTWLQYDNWVSKGGEVAKSVQASVCTMHIHIHVYRTWCTAIGTWALCLPILNGFGYFQATHLDTCTSEIFAYFSHSVTLVVRLFVCSFDFGWSFITSSHLISKFFPLFLALHRLNAL